MKNNPPTIRVKPELVSFWQNFLGQKRVPRSEQKLMRKALRYYKQELYSASIVLEGASAGRLHGQVADFLFLLSEDLSSMEKAFAVFYDQNKSSARLCYMTMLDKLLAFNSELSRKAYSLYQKEKVPVYN
ncbi:MAG TPA: hypothetical protein PLQ20_00140 [Candidatus Paceibacterota bacterium]|nr:hypothetical protein [Candidatus Paceibacterota bacterium]